MEPSRVTLSILKVGGASTPASVKYRTLQGDALEGIDYLPLEGTARFDDGVTNVTVIFQILEDLIPEAPETFQVELYEAIGEDRFHFAREMNFRKFTLANLMISLMLMMNCLCQPTLVEIESSLFIVCVLSTIMSSQF